MVKINDNSKEFQKKKVKMEEEKTSLGNEVFGSFQKKKKKNQGDTEKRNKFRASPFSCTSTLLSVIRNIYVARERR